jgi:hypothetical protein
MKPDDSLRRYSREEMHRILEIASEDEGPRPGAAAELDGLTLPEIQDIAREVGIDPRRVTHASMVAEARLAPQVSLGTYQLERRFGRILEPDEMRFVAEEADRYFGVEGKVRQTHDYAEWYSSEARAFVGVVNDSETTRVRVILDRASEFFVGGGLIGLLAILPMTVVVSAAPGIMGVGGALAIAAASAGVIAGFWKWRRAAAIRRIERLIESMIAGPVSLGGPSGGA